MDELALSIIEKTFHEKPVSLVRKKTGLCNEVYEAAFTNHEPVILRVGKTSADLLGSSKYIPLFKMRGISVPNIISEDYSSKLFPYPYQILSKVNGADLGEVFDSLEQDELRGIASSITSIFDKLKTINTYGRYGEVGFDGVGPYPSWSFYLESITSEISDRILHTKTVSPDLVAQVKKMLNEQESYYKTVISVFYYDDINAKNVMVDNGKFVGLLDLDSVSYGDPLFALGSIIAAWPLSENGKYYINQIYADMKLTLTEIKNVELYAILHRLYWLSEVGIKFNDNTTGEIDKDKVARGTEVLQKLIKVYLSK